MTNDNNAQRQALKEQSLTLMNSRRFGEARTLISKMCDLDAQDAEAWHMLSYVNGMLGNIDEAGECCRRVLALQPDRAEAHLYLGNVLLGQGRHDEAAESFQRAIQLKPDLAIAYFNLGNLYLQGGQYDQAVSHYCRAVELNPVDAQISAVREKGQVLLQENRLKEAKPLFARLCQLHPKDAQAWYTLSTIHGSLGEINEAGDCCRRVLAIQPDHSEAHANLGNVFFYYRQFDEAIAQYERAVEIDPKNVTALNNMGKACQTDDHIGRYIGHYRRVIAGVPSPAEARVTFSEVMQHKSPYPAEYTAWLDEELQECFSADGVDYQLLAHVSARLLKFKYHIRPDTEGGDDEARGMIDRLASDRLFLMRLEKVVNTDADLELLLTRVRRVLLLDYCREGSLARGEAGLARALACQGINNEYVFAVDAEEERRVAALRQEVEQCAPSRLAPAKELEGRLLIFGMYDRLSSLSCREDLSRAPLDGWSEAFRPFLMEALINPLEEERIKEDIVSLGGIENQISRLVQSQYEENPYPRWVVTGKRPKLNMRQGLQSTFPHFVAPPFLDGPIRILIAGCGTGRQAIQAALGYSDVEILAVDISKASLAYATRMARKYGVDNIEFMQGDILGLANLDRRFHYIECIGVLHHMENPLAGWRVLADLLVEDGLMQIGLYSELARKVVVEAREIIRREALGSDRDTIRDFRARVWRGELGDRLYAMARNSEDFFSTSDCRDLLFHYNEHRYTLAQLKRELQELELGFIGFKAFKNIRSRRLVSQPISGGQGHDGSRLMGPL